MSSWGSLQGTKNLFELVNIKQSFGRADFGGSNPEISGVHFEISLRVMEDVQTVWVTDKSTNGTYINQSSTPIGKDNSKLIEHLDTISILNPQKENSILLCFYDATKKLNAIEQNYIVLNKIGSGSYGSVWKVINKKTQEIFALKQITKSPQNTTGSTREDAILDEVNTLSKVNHKNIIKIIEHLETETDLFIVLEYAGGRGLEERLPEEGFSEDKAQYIIYQVLSGISYLHDKNIIHRDIKPENILFSASDSEEIKITDFNASRILDDTFAATMIGTADYFAPEIRSLSGYSFPADMWSIGVLTYAALTGELPFDYSSFVPNMSATAKDLKDERITDDARDLMLHLFRIEPNERLTAKEAMNHKWFANVRKKLKEEDNNTETKNDIDEKKEQIFEEIVGKRHRESNETPKVTSKDKSKSTPKVDSPGLKKTKIEAQSTPIQKRSSRTPRTSRTPVAVSPAVHKMTTRSRSKQM